MVLKNKSAEVGKWDKEGRKAIQGEVSAHSHLGNRWEMLWNKLGILPVEYVKLQHLSISSHAQCLTFTLTALVPAYVRTSKLTWYQRKPQAEKRCPDVRYYEDDSTREAILPYGCRWTQVGQGSTSSVWHTSQCNLVNESELPSPGQSVEPLYSSSLRTWETCQIAYKCVQSTVQVQRIIFSLNPYSFQEKTFSH